MRGIGDLDAKVHREGKKEWGDAGCEIISHCYIDANVGEDHDAPPQGPVLDLVRRNATSCC